MTNVHESISKTHRPSLKEIDTQRASNSAYNYLCHLEECKQWIEKMINKEYIDIKDFESQLCNGIDLCLLALKFSPESVKKIHYGKRRTASKAKVEITGNNKITGETTSEKDYRYTDNIYFFLSALRTINLPEYFLFDTVSLYEGKNIHSVVYCLHALCHFLNYKGYTNIRINTLYGMEFSSALIEEKNEELKERERMGMKIPEFKNITKVMHKDFLSDLLTRIKYHCHALQRKEKRDKEERARQLLEEQMQISEKNKSKQAENYRLSVTKDRLFFHILDSLSHKSDDTVSTALKTFLYKNVFHELIDKKRISIFTIKFYLFIFYDSNNEIKKENEIERIINDCNILRNENYEIEKYNDELEMRVNLLLNNKINASNISVVKPRLEDVMDTNYAYDTEGYNFVFNVMQTEPEWLCFLFERVKHINDFIMTGVINLFSNERAEEMYLLSLTECAFRKLVDRITKVQKHKEDKHSCNNSYVHKELMHGYGDNAYNTSYINERVYFEDDFDSLSFLNEQPLFLGIKALMGVYFKGLHNAFKDSLINNIRNLESFEFENDPAKIYKNIFDVDISREDALKNETVSKIYLTRLKTLRGVIDGIIDLLFKHTNDFSVCIRVFMKSLRSVHVKESDLLSLFFKEFMYPFVIGPDAYSDFKVTPDTRDKLKMVVKGFECAINGESVYSLRPLERFFKESKQRLIEFVTKFTSIEETYDYGYIFNVKPCVIFTGKQANLFTSTVYDCINACGGAKACDLSVLQRKKEVNDSTVIHDSSLIYDSSAIYNNTEINAKHTSTVFTDDRNAELSTFMHTCDGVKLPFLTKMIDILEYRKSLPDTDKPINFYLNKPVTEDAAENEQDKFVKRLKMKVIELLRIANGRNLLDVIIRDSGSEEEKEYQERIEELRSKAMEQGLSHSSSQSIMFLNSSNLYDIYLVNNEIRYPDLNSFKDSIYDEMQILEGMKIVRRENHYNDMLCLLAEDILRVKYMSKERNRCLDIHKRNLAGLKDRKEEVRALMKNMETYLTSYVKTTFKNKGNIKGKDCEFGSFKVPGSKLKKKGVLIEMHRNGQETITDSNECIKDLTFVFMCEEPGIFVVEIFMHTVVVNTFSFRFDELLKLRFRRIDNFVIKEVCTFEVAKLTELLNKHYVN